MAKAKKTPEKKPGKKAAAAAEDNQLALPMPKERDLKHYISEYQLADAAVKKAKQHLDKIVASADEAGVSVPAIKRGLKIVASKNLIQAKSDLMQLSMVLEELGCPLQIQVFEAKFGGPEAEAKAAGYRDGKAGRDRDYGQWVKGSPARRAYDGGYEEAQIENMPISEEAKTQAKGRLKAPTEGNAPLQH